MLKSKLPTREQWRASQPQMPRPVPPFESEVYQEFRRKLEEWAEIGRKIDLEALPKTKGIHRKEWNNGTP